MKCVAIPDVVVMSRKSLAKYVLITNMYHKSLDPDILLKTRCYSSTGFTP